ncbi:hypothetical protein [Lewinella sp. IMCC34183]|uniref:hypothetical protein n=1 Tax=Lewinella sp. IMCC34183 TaxID=2248762 RepID=UPI000E221081|nr:hypothetical protein [Lewinella sp. IMCC34183]
MTIKRISQCLCLLGGLLELLSAFLEFSSTDNLVLGSYLSCVALLALVAGFSGFFLDFRREFFERRSARS